MKRFLVSLSSLLLIVGVVFYPAQDAQAAWNPNLIMSDEIFDSAGTMSTDGIQNFLNGFANSCIKNYQSPYPNGYNDYGGNVSAATVIRRAADIYGFNPQVILATLQKEQSLVTGPNCEAWRYNSAMGMGCPDGGQCPAPGYEGFSKQVTKGSWLLKFGKERANGNVNWTANDGVGGDPYVYYSGPMTQGCYKRQIDAPTVCYDGYWTIDGQTVHIDSGTTGSLYNYTPHFHGNQNFVNIFESWFGSVHACTNTKLAITTLGVYDPAGYFHQRNCLTPGSASHSPQFGNANWTPLSGDWNNDGVFTPGAYDPSTGRFYLRNFNSSGPADISFQYGNLGWIPVSGDWNSNGYWSIGMYDPGSSTFYLKDFNGAGSADYVANFGNGGWKPISGDWDRNGSTTIGVYNPNTAVYYLNDQIDGSAAEKVFNYGNVGWTPIAGDWDGNGYWSIGAFDGGSATFYLRNLNGAGGADITVQYGNAGWLPVVGDWDGR